MNPEERTRKAQVWRRVEELLFSPSGENEQRQWCACYLRSLASFWGLPEFAVGTPFPRAEFALPLPGFCLSYDLSEWNSSPKRASVRMKFEGVLFAAYDVDHACQTRRSLLNEPEDSLLGKYPQVAARASDVAGDVQWVLDRFVLHPCAHVHMMPDIFGCLRDDHEPFRDVVHEIRLGFGQTNPFAALFQLRTQFALGHAVEDTKVWKEAERDRVAKLVSEAVLQGAGTQRIPPGRLFVRNK